MMARSRWFGKVWLKIASREGVWTWASLLRRSCVMGASWAAVIVGAVSAAGEGRRREQRLSPGSDRG